MLALSSYEILFEILKIVNVEHATPVDSITKHGEPSIASFTFQLFNPVYFQF